MQKNVKEGPFGVFEHPLFCKIEKMKGGHFGDIKKICEKSLTKPKKPAQKNLDKGGNRTHVFCLADLKQAVTSMTKASRSIVAQLSVSASALIKLIKSVSSLVLKKKRHYYSLRFSTESAD